MKNVAFWLGAGLVSTASLVTIAGCSDDTGTGGGGTTGAQTTTGSNTTATGMGGAGTTTSTSTSTTTTGATTAAGMFDCGAPAGAAPNLTLTLIDSFSRPVLVKSAPDDADRLYVMEQDGVVRIYENGATLPTPFINATALIDPASGNEEGLLGLAFHPDYANNGRFFLHYTGTNNSETTITEFARSNDPLVANPTPVQSVLIQPTEQSNHNGGSIEFGSDGFLYIGIGDGGGSDDTDCDSQDVSTNLLGKVSRIDVDGTPDANGYPAAAGNPNGAKYFHLGTRNPWRMSFDVCTGDLYIGDVGQNQYEEISFAKPSDGARNFGWPMREGAHDFNNYNGNCPVEPANVDPIAEYTHGGGRCSVTGGYVYRGSAIPALRGYYLYADYCVGTIWMLRHDGTSVVDGPTDTGLNGGNVAGFGQDGHGNVYVCDLGGDVYRIDAQ